VIGSTTRVPAIVVAAHRRPAALTRLLDSIARAAYPPAADVPLVISIDPLPPGHPAAGAGGDVQRVAAAFEWQHGARTVIVRPRPLGLVGHFIACGALSAEFGSIVFLEDDLAVSGAFYPSALAMLEAYGDDERVALACLYALWFGGFDLEPFEPIDDGSDGFFLGVPYTLGLAFTAEQWARLAPALDPAHSFIPDARLHPAFVALGADEWFPRLANACVATDRRVAFPRRSLVTCWGDAGTHFPRPTRGFQAALQRGAALERWLPLDRSDAVYDPFFELDAGVLARLAPRFADLDVELDLRATKPRAAIRARHVLTTRRCRRAVERYGLAARPMEANVIDAVPGDEISLAAADDVDWSEAAGRRARRHVRAFLAHDRQASIRRLLGDRLGALGERATGADR
jgi:hypothetical protein